MIASVEQAKSPERKPAAPRVRQYVGEVVYIYAFDVAYEMTRQPVRELLGQPARSVSTWTGAGGLTPGPRA